jgi:Amidohydrolase
MFNTKFRDLIFACEKDPEVVGFKSIAAYRTGLAVSTSDTQANIEKSLCDAIKSCRESGGRSLRLQHKPFNDYIIRTALDLAKKPGESIIRKYNFHFASPTSCVFVVQFHTGLGDADLLLATATPTLLQPLIRAYPRVTFVLLHSSWPFSQEAGYLAAMYKNVFLDFGEVFPQVSAQGQRDLIHALLELCPTNKIMWSCELRRLHCICEESDQEFL